MPASNVRFSRSGLRTASAPAAPAALGALAALAALAPMLSLAADAAPITYVPHTTPPGSAPLPFSDATLAGDTLYVAGHIGFDARGNVPADADAEARQVMDAVKHTVEAAGLTMDNLVSVTIFCTDLALYDRFNAVYRGYFHGHYPARAFIGAERLLRGAHFEVMGVAVRAP